ncbi:hypothetical protein F9L48_22260 [Escherichia coli]|nr:hypothetical protein [Escherichia coli]EFB5266071.1 hypothetical protein [Escherichia coli]EFF1044447.1 hypothetical protein [Escherichia coli]EFH9011979.1 hypothetical protein [Escherichia coli]
MALYVVLYPWTVMRRAGAENSDMMISSAWYTSGKSFIQIKSDPYETGIFPDHRLCGCRCFRMPLCHCFV